MYISFNEFRVLRTLSDGEQHDKAPKGLTEAQFCVAVKSLKMKNLVYAAFEEGGKVVSSQIKMEGRAVLDDLKGQEKKIHKHTTNSISNKNSQDNNHGRFFWLVRHFE